MRKFFYWFSSVVVGLTLGMLIGERLLSDIDKHKTYIYEEGIQDRKDGIPAEANPYTTEERRLLWLKGWKKQ